MKDNKQEVSLNLDKRDLLSILKTAAAKERAVIEFRTEEVNGERQLNHAIEITDHVESLEEDL